MKLFHMILAVIAVWMSVMGTMAAPTDVAYKMSVREQGDVPAGLENITPEERIEVMAALNENIVDSQHGNTDDF